MLIFIATYFLIVLVYGVQIALQYQIDRGRSSHVSIWFLIWNNFNSSKMFFLNLDMMNISTVLLISMLMMTMMLVKQRGHIPWQIYLHVCTWLLPWRTKSHPVKWYLKVSVVLRCFFLSTTTNISTGRFSVHQVAWKIVVDKRFLQFPVDMVDDFWLK